MVVVEASSSRVAKFELEKLSEVRVRGDGGKFWPKSEGGKLLSAGKGQPGNESKQALCVPEHSAGTSSRECSCPVKRRMSIQSFLHLMSLSSVVDATED
jgi:hypothetical protein